MKTTMSSEERIIEAGIPAEINDAFVFIEASKLSLNDEFMQHDPQTPAEERLKKLLERAIRNGVKDFYCPKYAPSLNVEGTGICYMPGKKPAVGQTYTWWEQIATDFNPSHNSRLGSRWEYVAFLGVLIKRLLAAGWSEKAVWNSVCNDSRKLGYYWNLDTDNNGLELTGSREICGLYDLSNVLKILSSEGEFEGFWVAGGAYCYNSYDFPIADLHRKFCSHSENDFGVGWIVLEKTPTDN